VVPSLFKNITSLLENKLNKKKVLDSEEIFERSLKRLANLLYEEWEEGDGTNSRIFEWIVRDKYLIKEKSENLTLELIKKRKYRREHPVPLSYIRNECYKLFEAMTFHDNDSINAIKNVVVNILRRSLIIVLITNEEAIELDGPKYNIKFSMPGEKWCFDSGDVFARLIKAQIGLKMLTEEELQIINKIKTNKLAA
jgi:hypothetical protein